MACFAAPTSDRFISPLLGYLDCQALTLGSSGYQALAAPGSSVSLMLGAMLAILIAIIGYRMLLGETPVLRDGVTIFVRIGVVLAFTSSWPAYRTVVYDVVLRAPADLAAEIGGSAQLPGTTGGLVGRLDQLDQTFRTLAIYGVGVPTRSQVEEAQGVAPPLFASFDSFALGAGRVAFLIGSVGAFALLRLGAGLLLALGPLFIAFLLFDATRGLFVGWLRALIGIALGSVAASLVLGVQLGVFEPWLAGLAAQRAAGQGIPNAATSVLAASLIFAFALFALIAVVARLASAWHLPLGRFGMAGGGAERDASSGRTSTGNDTIAQRATTDNRSRAAAVADHMAATIRREAQGPAGQRVITIAGDRGSADPAATASPSSSAVPLGRSFRRTKTRTSISAGARDRMA
ncbi:type IV secretion system protein [Sphingomonas adhaesiva]|uniref:type IV secretion system protein n=1 Tax=Sphingomonas adhaesiva TaxID=28212 RepID=UPI002FFA7272